MKRIMNIDSKKPHNIKIIFIILLVLAIFVLSTIFFMYYSDIYSDNAAVFTVNGEPVSKVEFLNTMSGLKASVYSYFVQRYGVTEDKKFWTTGINGEIPVEILKEKTIDKLTRVKAEQIILKEYGLVRDISYSGFLKELKAENERRKKALENNEPVYGPHRFGEAVYYDVLQKNRIEELKNKLSTSELLPSDEEIKNFYSENKEKIYKKPDYIRFGEIHLVYSDEKRNTMPDKKKYAQNIIKQIKEEADRGRNLEDIVSAYKTRGEEWIEYKEFVFDDKNYYNYMKMYPRITLVLSDLEEGQISSIIDDNQAFSIIKIFEKRPLGYKNLEEVKAQIVKELVDNKFNEMVDKLVKEAKIDINYKVYNRIFM